MLYFSKEAIAEHRLLICFSWVTENEQNKTPKPFFLPQPQLCQCCLVLELPGTPRLASAGLWHPEPGLPPPAAWQRLAEPFIPDPLRARCWRGPGTGFAILFLWPRGSPALLGPCSTTREAKIWYFWCTDASTIVYIEAELTFQATFLYHKEVQINS